MEKYWICESEEAGNIWMYIRVGGAVKIQKGRIKAGETSLKKAALLLFEMTWKMAKQMGAFFLFFKRLWKRKVLSRKRWRHWCRQMYLSYQLPVWLSILWSGLWVLLSDKTAVWSFPVSVGRWTSGVWTSGWRKCERLLSWRKVTPPLTRWHTGNSAVFVHQLTPRSLYWAMIAFWTSVSTT